MTEEELVSKADEIKRLAARMKGVTEAHNTLLHTDEPNREFARSFSPRPSDFDSSEMAAMVKVAVLAAFQAEAVRCRDEMRRVALSMAEQDDGAKVEAIKANEESSRADDAQWVSGSELDHV